MDKPHKSTNTRSETLRLLRRARPRKRFQQLQKIAVVTIVFIGLFSYLTNPFTRFSVVKDPIGFRENTGIVEAVLSGKLYLVDNRITRGVAFLQSGWHILTNRFSGGGATAPEETVEGIIDNIHKLRFNPKDLFLISGDHFVMLYPRSLGVFYNSILDPRTARSKTDWQNRQEIYLKTTLYALEAYKNSPNLSTTIAPIGPRSITLVNFFNPPSDTLYSLFYALTTLRSTDEMIRIYPYERPDSVQYSLETQRSTEKILLVYHNMLVRHFNSYIASVTDPMTGLIRKDITLSGTKDSVVRKSAFYDNVILWKTNELAQELGFIPSDPAYLDSLKQKIISSFWLPKQGYFLEELSEDAIAHKKYSSDWLVAVMTGFLKPNNPAEREYIARSIAYIHANSLDRPFALQYEPDSQKDDLHFIVFMGTSTYGTKAIWSNWGMEYIKALLLLYQNTCKKAYIDEATYQVHQYTENIVTTHGYPEVYDKKGQPYQTMLYASVHQTGWVVSFEQARAMLDYTRSRACTLQ